MRRRARSENFTSPESFTNARLPVAPSSSTRAEAGLVEAWRPSVGRPQWSTRARATAEFARERHHRHELAVLLDF